MATIQEALDEKIALLLQESFTRFCAREGRHGETYLLEKGIRQGLIQYLTPKIKELLYEITE